MGFSIGTLCAALLFLVLFLIFSILHYNKKFKNKYNIASFFPYELNYDANPKENIYGNVALVLSIFFIFGFLLTYDLPFSDGWLIFMFVSGTLSSVLVSLIVLVPLKHLKLHTSLFVIQFVLSFALLASISVYCMKNYNMSSETIYLVIFIFSIIGALSMFALGMNPKLSLNIKYQTKVNKNGDEYAIRPKFISLAFTEWYSIFALYYSIILLLILKIGQ